LAIVAMIVLKRREIVALKNNPISKISARADSFLDKNYSAIRKFISYLNKHTFIAITQWIVYHILLHIRKVYVEIKHQALQNPHTRNMIYAVRGKGEVIEERIEILCERKVIKNVIDAIKKVHPYEEVAFDIYPLESYN
jgi:hypothetical protein